MSALAAKVSVAWNRLAARLSNSRSLLALLLLLLLGGLMAVLVQVIPGAEDSHTGGAAALGFLILAAYLAGQVAQPYRLPKITGYLLAGIVFGPYVLNLVQEPDAERLDLINRLALGIIALTAGGELRLAKLRRQIRAISTFVGLRFVLIPLSVALVLYLLFDALSVAEAATAAQRVAAVVLLGLIATAISPSTTVAVITETDSAGPVTELSLAVAVTIDVAILLVFAPALALAEVISQPGASFQLTLMARVSWEILSALPIGILLGAGVVWYLRTVREEISIFLVGVVFFAVEFTNAIHSDPVLTCLVVGFVVENYSDQGEVLIETVESSSLPIYAVFFAVAGAALNLDALRARWVAALTIVLVRLGMTVVSTGMAARRVASAPTVRRYLWTGFLGQAGVSLGLAQLIAESLPAPLGTDLRTLIVASIVVNQVIGPVIFRLGLEKSGEIGQRAARVVKPPARR